MTQPQDEHQSFWLWVMCLTGVDYFSTLGYQPSIAFDATGRLAPLATVVLIVVTLSCALPVYCHVASESPHGQGSIAMLERLLRGWTAKFMVLVLLGFAATDFVITKTLSAADAAEHLIHNPFWSAAPEWLHSQILVTSFLLMLLAAMFLRGFREVILLAVIIVGAYLLLNLIVIGSGLWYLTMHGEELTEWMRAVNSGDWYLEEAAWARRDVWGILAVCLLFFPKLALGLSGFETGVAVMPLVKGEVDDDPQRPAARIRNTRKLLIVAAAIMSVMLLGSTMVCSTLIEPHELEPGGGAENRALAYLAHGEAGTHITPFFGSVFGTIYDISTVIILWFAGASAMSGLLNLVPRYLPRYGMAPRWAEAFRPLVLIFTVINLAVTWIFGASVSAQGGAYATGVMVLMTSASVAVVIDHYRRNAGWLVDERGVVAKAVDDPPLPQTDGMAAEQPIAAVAPRSLLRCIPWRYVLITLIFLYTTIDIVIAKPDGIKIAGTFIFVVILISLISRMQRSTELRFEHFDFVDNTSRLLWDTLRHLEFPVLVPHRPGNRSVAEKEKLIRHAHRLAEDVPIVFIEAVLGDASDFEQCPLMEVSQSEGRFVIRVTRCVSVAHAIATIALELSKVGKPPELHFGWSAESPLVANFGFLLFGEGNVPWLVRELLRRAESDGGKRPRVIIG